MSEPMNLDQYRTDGRWRGEEEQRRLPVRLSATERGVVADTLRATVSSMVEGSDHVDAGVWLWLLPDGTPTKHSEPAVAIIRLNDTQLYARVYPEGSTGTLIRYYKAESPEEAVVSFIAACNWAIEAYKEAAR